MKANRKVIDSIAVASLAMALSITAVTTNGENISGTNDAGSTQTESNGIAGVAAVMNAYDLESTELLDQCISVEKQEVYQVSSPMDTISEQRSAEADAKAGMAEAAKEKQAPVSKIEKEWENKLMADVDEFLYVRAKADAD